MLEKTWNLKWDMGEALKTHVHIGCNSVTPGVGMHGDLMCG